MREVSKKSYEKKYEAIREVCALFLRRDDIELPAILIKGQGAKNQPYLLTLYVANNRCRSKTQWKELAEICDALMLIIEEFNAYYRDTVFAEED